MCPNGVIMAGLDKSLSIGLMQANEWRPSQFIAQEPQIPSLQDLLKDKVESYLSLIFNTASKYIGAQVFKST